MTKEIDTMHLRVARLALALILALTLGLVGAGPASADFGIKPGSFVATIQDDSGTYMPQAGGHPNATTGFMLNTTTTPQNKVIPDGTLKDVEVDLPAGVVGNPQAAGQCSAADFAGSALGSASCPIASQVGIATVYTQALVGGPVQARTVGLYNLVPSNGSTAQLGFTLNVTNNILITASVRSEGDYGLKAVVHNNPGGVLLHGVSLTFWGVPAAAVHDPQRCNTRATGSTLCAGGGSPSPAERLPFFTNSTLCGPAVPTTMRASSWEHPDQWSTATYTTPTGPTGCDQLAFHPSIAVRPDTTQADSPSGYTVDLQVPQNQDPDGLATPTLRDVEVTMPEGVSISPSAADGLQGCTDEEFAQHSSTPARCGDATKIGTLRIETPLLADPLEGEVFLAQPLSTDPQSGQMFRIYLQAQGSGVIVKLPGSVVADPQTGRLKATFTANPQLPFGRFLLHFRGGPRAVLANPATCGVVATSATLTPWSAPDSGPPATATDGFAIDAGPHGSPCVTDVGERPFLPALNAGSIDPAAGGSSPFSLTFTRGDGEQNLHSIDVELPPGLVGRVGDVPLCSEEQATAGTCGDASRVGSVTVGAGPGDQPVFLPQLGRSPTAVYLAGPYKGAPFSLSMVVPAQAGPYDLGTVVVRAALFIDRHDAHVTVRSDPLPTILGGIPLRVRSVNVTLDRPGFMVQPTSCAPASIGARLVGTEGAVASAASRYQARGCADLPFDPDFSAATRGRLTFKHGAALDVHVAARPGDANIRSVSVRLPKELPSRLIPTINNACLIEQFQADYRACPEQSYVGTVTAVTPILALPLTGPVYIVAVPGDVPRLELKLFGQGDASGVEVDLEGTVIINSGGGRTKATFSAVPDVPITRFDVRLPTGPHSMLDAPSNDLCKGPITMDVSIVGQNGRRRNSSKPIAVRDCPKVAAPKVVSARATRSGVRVRVRMRALGRLEASGSGLVAVSRKIDRKVTFTVNLPLSAAGRRALARRGSLRTRPTIWFEPTNSPRTNVLRVRTLKIQRSRR